MTLACLQLLFSNGSLPRYVRCSKHMIFASICGLAHNGPREGRAKNSITALRVVGREYKVIHGLILQASHPDPGNIDTRISARKLRVSANQKSMALSTGLGSKNDLAGEGQKQV
jgi:hypothetical protein